MKGKFIVFEGIDGCGKGTQIKKTASYIFDKSKDYDIFLTREPTRDFKEIRKKMADDKSAYDNNEWYAKMFVADRKNHIEKYILPNIKKGVHVLSDRYKHSTIAYQNTQGMPLKELLEMHKDLLVPDLTFIFDCSHKTAYSRRQSEGATDNFEKDIGFQKKLAEKYASMKDILLEDNIIMIDAEDTIENIFKKVKKEIDNIL